MRTMDMSKFKRVIEIKFFYISRIEKDDIFFQVEKDKKLY